MRAFLRADPDIIMVGESHDKETVAMGAEASLTGHLVFSTLHTNSAPAWPKSSPQRWKAECAP